MLNLLRLTGKHLRRSGIALVLGIGSGLAPAHGLDSIQARAWEDGIRQTLRIAEPLPAVAPQSHGRFQPEPGIVAERISFGTLYGLRVPAIAYRRQGVAGPAPALVVVNGHGGDKYAWYAFYAGILYARAGAVVLTYDPLGEGERNPEHKSGSRAHDNLEPNSRELGCIMAGQMVVDLRQAIRYLRTRPDVDPERVGAVGYSLGTVVIGFTGALEEHLAAAVLAGGGNWDGPGGYWDHGKPLCCGYPFQSLRSLGDLPAVLYALRARYGPTLVYNGLADDIVNATAEGRLVMQNIQTRTAQLLGSATPPFDTGFEEGISHRPFFVTRPVALWLERKLDFPNWTPEDIEKMPTSRIGTWAKENSVETDDYYATELREAGTVALGTGVPGLSREQLSIFPRSEWEVRKPRFTIDVWHRRVEEMMGQAGPSSVKLVQQGRAMATLVVSPNASTSERQAAFELQRFIYKSTDVSLPVAYDATGTRILVGESLLPQEASVEARSLQTEGFMIETTPGGDVIVAGSGGQGTLYAAYGFLEKYLGVSWPWPSELGEIVPHHADLAIPFPTWHVEEPAFLWRDLGPYGRMWGWRGWDKWEAGRQLGFTAEHEEAERTWEQRNRFGGLKIYGGHAFGEILPPKKYGESHPEYFALVNGKRDAGWEDFDGKHEHQPCTSNPDVIRTTIDYIRAFFNQHPEYDAFSIGLNDGTGYCECERCLALDAGATAEGQAGPEFGPGGRQRVITDRILTFANQVAEGVAETHPNKKLILYAYSQYQSPPTRVVPHPSIMIHYCMLTDHHWNREFAEEDFAMLSRWGDCGVSQLAIYDYFVRGGWPDLPRPFPLLVEESVRRSQAAGVRYYQAQHGDGYAINGINYYALGKLLWDSSLDAGEIEREYLQALFPLAATPVERYFQRLAARYRESGGDMMADGAQLNQYQPIVKLFSADALEACRRDLEDASALARGVEKQRVERLLAGLRYTELTVQAVQATIPLLEAGWRLQGKVVPPPSPDMGAFNRALSAWKTRDSYVDSLTNDWVLAIMWIKYNNLYRGWNPRVAMEKYLQSPRQP